MAKYLVNYLDRQSHINKNIYGHFAEHLGRMVYDGFWVGKDSPVPNIGGVRKDIIDALKHIRVPLIRWPGGCFADTYHWKDGIGTERKNIANRYWGGVVENNSFGTHEFMDMCEEIGCGAYLSGNLGSGTIQEMVEWVEYIRDDIDTPMAQLRRKNGREKPWKLEAFGIGNEVWGCGGQMTPEYYATQYRQAAHFIKTATNGGIAAMLNGEHTEKLKLIASGPNADDYSFTEKFIEGLNGGYQLNAAMNGFMADGMSCHYYSFPNMREALSAGGNFLTNLKTAEEFGEKDWYYLLNEAAKIDGIITQHDHVMSKFDPKKMIGLAVDEWGAWHGPEKGTNPAFLFQQNTMRDAVLAALSLNIFNKHSDRVHLTTIAQMINVLQSIILTEGDKMVLTPTYYVYDMYKDHQNATLLGSYVEKHGVGEAGYVLNNIYESCSVDAEGNMLCTLCNTSLDNSETIDATIFGTKIKSAAATILTDDPHACNTFERPDRVGLKSWTVEITDNGFRCELPAASVVSLKLAI